MNRLNLAECERQCLIDPECISFETSEEHYNGTFLCRNQVGSGRNFRVECDLNLDQQKRKCYKRDKSSNWIIHNLLSQANKSLIDSIYDELNSILCF